MLDTYKIVIAACLMTDKANRIRCFEKTFLVANISPEVVFKMFFLTLSGADVDFLDWKLRQKTYATKEALPTTKYVKLVDKKKFATVVFDLEYEIYVVHVGSVSFVALPNSSPPKPNIHPFCRPQVSSLIAKEDLTKVSNKYVDFVDIFSPDLVSKLPKYTEINNHAIKLVDGQQPLYGPIYSLEPVELEILKACIKTNLANGFIIPSKSPSILFSYLIGSQIVLSDCVSTIKVSITSQSRTDIRCH